MMLKTIAAAACAVLFLTGASAPLPVLTAPVPVVMTKVQDDECKNQCISACIKMGGAQRYCAITSMDTVCAYEPAVANLPK